MRDDFHKVVIERARWGSRLPNLKTRWSTARYDPDADYGLPKTWDEPQKSFSDHLSPLRRYLQKQVGRPWRKVEAEILRTLDIRNLIGKHLWTHAKQMVETEVRMTPDGRALGLRGYDVRDLYVHPRTGILRRQKPGRSDPHRERLERIAAAERIVLDARVSAEKVKDLWYLYIDTGRTEEVIDVSRDPLGRRVHTHRTRPVIRKKQANREELRRIRDALDRSL